MMQELSEFLTIAKVNTFASEMIKPKRRDDGSKMYIFCEGDFKYQDIYYGKLIDSGQEIVWSSESPVWCMAYRGGMLSHEKMSEKCFEFLKLCLKSIPEEFPARGPKYFKKGAFEYYNVWKGDIFSFSGEEEIRFKNEKIYFRNYLGGLIKYY